MKKTLLKTFYNIGAFAPFHWASRDKVLILTYHRFSADAHPSKISAREFAAHLEYLKRHNHVLSLSEAAEHLRNEKSLPPNATVITIDDGYSDAYEVAFPILKQFEMPATLYVVTDFLDRKCWLWTDLMRYVLTETKKDFLKLEFENGDSIEMKLTDVQQRLETANRLNRRLKQMPNTAKEAKIEAIAGILEVQIPAVPSGEFAPITWERAREMDANNLSIESHTVSHPILTNINQAELDYELQTSKKRLETALGRTIENFCYPNGTFDAKVSQAVENAGYRCAVTTNYGFNEKQANQFALNRIDALAEIENFAQSVSGFEALRNRN
ncbi:MAG TPA: polysaccharide deacetylase family protein [Pyrinomonadaceae bacterium]|nr:polysaccharide deacetylase family protein [Pyrinomonadaceae bacterium]